MTTVHDPVFRAYVEHQTALFVESMQDHAENQWDLLRWRMEGASEEEIGAEMERWWDRQTRRFQRRLLDEYRRDQAKRLRRRLRREKGLRFRAEERLEATQAELQEAEAELHEAKADLTIERGVVTYLKEARRCRDCNGKLWDF